MSAICLEWGVARRLLPGQTEAGDQHVICAIPGGAFAAVVDAVGHGEEAAPIGRAAVSVLEENAVEHVIPLVQRCHDKLRSTRGVVLSLASFNTKDGVMTWMGVGNVCGVLLRPHREPHQATLLLRGGVVGSQLPLLHAEVVPVSPGDILIFATDGVHDGFVDAVHTGAPPQRLAEEILTRYAKNSDDALVLVARYTGVR